MQIIRLTLSGFKSFVEPTELLIEPGLTGIVGPNGCGKSNLLEALRWVMGETSYKNMRGAAMEDVIFAGTERRPARQFAEVTITLDNTARTAPPAFNEFDTLEISRKIIRDEGSQYRINGREVRAKDVQLLFADNATGAHSPALVQQNRIGDLVNARPQARRLILEQAAGIAGLHSRRHEAELRLRGAEDNLKRLSDIFGQMSAQLERLKRQARQARRYKELGRKIRRTEALILYSKWRQTREELAVANEHRRAIENLISELGQNETRLRNEIESASRALQPLRDEEAIAAAVLERLKMAELALADEEQRLIARQQEIAERHETTHSDLARETAMKEEAAQFLQKLISEQQELAQTSADDDAAREQARLDQTTTAQALQKAEERLRDLTQRAAAEMAERRQWQAQITQHQQRLANLKTEYQDTQKALAEMAQSGALLPQIEAQTNTITSFEQELNAAETALQAQKARREAAATDLNRARAAADNARLAAERLRTEIATLEALLGREDGNPRSLSRALRVKPGLEAALAAALGDDLEASLDLADPVHWRALPPSSQRQRPPLPDGCTPLSDFVSGSEAVQWRLQLTGLVDADEGPRLQARLQPGQRLVSRAGDLWRWDGYVARATAETPAARRLAQRNRLTVLKQDNQRAQQELRAATEHFEQARKTARALDQAVKDATGKLAQDRRTLDEARRRLITLEQQAQAERTRHATLSEKQTRLAHEIEQTQQALNEAQAALKRLPPQQDLRAITATQEAELQRRREAHLEATTRLRALVSAQENRKARLAAIATDLEFWRQRQQAAVAQSEKLRQRLEALAQERQKLQQRPAELQDKRAQLHDQLSQAETRRKKAADALVAAEKALQSQTKALEKVQAEHAAAREQRAAAMARAEAIETRLQTLHQAISDQLHCSPEDCLARLGLKDGEDQPPLPALSELEAALGQLKQARDRLGQVNLRADDELTEMTEKRAALQHEADDLEQAIAKLRRSIASLNAEGRKRLTTAFEEVNQHFEQLFTTLFGGGKAQLELVESDDPLKAGLEIIARPPGKKPQVLSLLSGGEKALTAMALIFAVFLTNPAPICVLDEVDAPLDDANVERFCHLLEAMQSQTETRFLIITHHPMTMARMDRLFGVTMIEKGISQLVSVDLEEAERLRETAA